MILGRNRMSVLVRARIYDVFQLSGHSLIYSEPLVELGGTVGDIESGVFVESMRQLKRQAGKGNFLQIHVSYVPIVPPGSGEQKTKPTQRAISDVRSAGLTPDLVHLSFFPLISPS
jgi:CTP synthase (UTP-ammonia lyase)